MGREQLVTKRKRENGMIGAYGDNVWVEHAKGKFVVMG